MLLYVGISYGDDLLSLASEGALSTMLLHIKLHGVVVVVSWLS